MITLDVRPYCHVCPDFEADVEKASEYFSFNERIALSDTVIRCKNRDRCKSIEQFLAKQSKKEK